MIVSHGKPMETLGRKATGLRVYTYDRRVATYTFIVEKATFYLKGSPFLSIRHCTESVSLRRIAAKECEK